MADSPLHDDVIDPPAGAKKLTDVRSREQDIAGVVAFGLSLISVALFVIAASLIRADRTARVPVVTWSRAAALSAILGGIASVACREQSLVGFRKTSRGLGGLGFGACGFLLSLGGAFFFLYYLGALYED